MGTANRSAASDGTPTFGLEWTLGDRLGKSLKYAGMKSQDMADIIGVARNTISNYLNDHTEPSKLAIKEWALRTGVPIEWLQTGEVTDPNQRTSDYKSAGSVVYMADFRARTTGVAS